jgi:uncharacterized protein (DUF2267 family)
MNHHEFVGQVQARAQLPDLGAAEVATRATLETLAERIKGAEPQNAASQLPQGIAEYMDHAWSGIGERFSLDEFFQRISEREGADLPDATYHSRVVLEVLQEALSQGEVEDIRSQLPDEFNSLFEAGSQGRMRVNA